MKFCLDYWPWDKDRRSFNLICVTTYFKNNLFQLCRGCSNGSQFISLFPIIKTGYGFSYPKAHSTARVSRGRLPLFPNAPVSLSSPSATGESPALRGHSVPLKYEHGSTFLHISLSLQCVIKGTALLLYTLLSINLTRELNLCYSSKAC